MTKRILLLPAVFGCLVSTAAFAHPAPDIPVESSFAAGQAEIRVEIDPRSFTDDPENEPYLYHRVLKLLSDEERKEMQEQARDLISKTIFFEFQPMRRVNPSFEFTFAGIGGAALEQDDDPVMIVGTAKVAVPEKSTGYRLIADESGELSVIFRNSIDGKEVPRVNVLFPGESSFVLELQKQS